MEATGYHESIDQDVRDSFVNRTPRIVVLLATHNGIAYLEEQLRSILGQTGVEVQVIISDDGSTDGTLDLLHELARESEQITVLEPGRFGSAAANFYRLIGDTEASSFDAVALCDQDDLWEPWKLQRHFALLTGELGSGAAAVSSNVTAFDAEGRAWLIKKDQPQRRADYLFESGGPGSTFLLSPETYAFVRAQLLDENAPARQVSAHDWCIYALVRASGRSWCIDALPSVRYRQHQQNVLGANQGMRQHLSRLRQIANRNYRHSVQQVITACESVAAADAREVISWTHERTARLHPVNRMRLARRAGEFRRRQRDQLVLAATILLGLW